MDFFMILVAERLSAGPDARLPPITTSWRRGPSSWGGEPWRRLGLPYWWRSLLGSCCS